MSKFTMDVEVDTEPRMVSFRAPVWTQRYCEDEARASWARAVKYGHVGHDEHGRRFARCIYFKNVLDMLADMMTAPWTAEQARTVSYVTWQPFASPSVACDAVEECATPPFMAHADVHRMAPEVTSTEAIRFVSDVWNADAVV